MGSADVVPGVSGGTMAFILGIYEELINSIKTIASFETVKMLLKFQFKRAYKELPWPFLVALGSGILIAVVTLVSPIKWMLANKPVLIWAFFFGLVLASIFTVLKKVGKWNAGTVTATILGAVAAWLIVGIIPVNTPNAWWFLIFCGAIAICAMILPGISGAFILALLGKYDFAAGAVHDLKTNLLKMKISESLDEISTIFWLGLGAVIGLVSFVQLLGWLLKRYHDLTVAVLIGFMAGSLRKIWPWKETLETTTNYKGEIIPKIQQNIMPPAFNNELWFAIILAVSGLVLVLIIEYIANRKSSTEKV
jgi:putative membrane protein